MKVYIVIWQMDEELTIEPFSTRELAEQYIRDKGWQVIDPITGDLVVYIEEKFLR